MATTTGPWYSIRKRTAMAAAALGIAAAAAEVLIYGDIGESWWGETVAASTFVREINALDVENLTVRINSIGGSVQDGIAIYNALKRHKAKIHTVVDSLAASIASLIAMAGDTVEMAENAMLMIHAPWGVVAGNAAELRDTADMLDQYAQAMSTSYAAKTGQTPDEVFALWLSDGKDHYFTAAKALDAKLIDSTTAPLPVAASMRLNVPLSRFRDAPPELAQLLNTVAQAAPKPAASAAPAAAPAAQQPPKEAPMPQSAEELAKAQAVTNDAVKAALAADTKRRADVKAALQPFAARSDISTEINALLNQAEANPDMTVEQVKAKALDIMGKNASSAAGSHVSVTTVEDEADKQRKGIQASLLIRAGIDKDDSTNPYRGYTLFELARASLERCGIRTGGMDKMGMVAAAFTHSTSDFPKLLSNLANKSMLKGYTEADETFQKWTTEGSLSDFKVTQRVDLNTFPALDKVAEGQEYKYGTIGERGEQVALATYGKLFSVTRQAIINDDLNALAKVPRLMGRAAIRTVGNLVWATLTGNPLMSDGKALFHADHGNLAAAGSTITTATVDAMRVLLATQKDENNAVLGVRPKFLLVPVALEGAAKTVLESEFEVGASTRNNSTPNIVRGTFEVVSDPRLDVASASTWYAAGDPGLYDTIEVSYLDGNKTPTLEEQTGWNVDGVEMKVRLDAAVKALSYRALAKNPGA